MKDLGEKKKKKVYITDIDEDRKAKYRRMAVFIVRHPVVKSMRSKIVTKRNIHGPIYAFIAGLSIVTLMVVSSTMHTLVNTPVYQPYYDARDAATQQAALLAGDYTNAKPAERSIPIRRNSLPTLPVTVVRLNAQTLLVTTEDSAAARAVDQGNADALALTQTQTTTQQSEVPTSDVVTPEPVVQEEEEEEEEEDEKEVDPTRLAPIDKKGSWDLVYFDKQSYEVDEDTEIEFDTDICKQNTSLGEGHEDVWCSETSKLKADNASKVGKDKCPSDCNIGSGCALWNTEQKKDEFKLYIGNYLCL